MDDNDFDNTSILDLSNDWQYQIAQFFDLCKEQMLRNRHKGMRETWTAQSLDAQLLSLQVSVAELRTALAYGVDVPDKAADVANWGFIIQDNFHHNPELIGLPPTKRFTSD